MRRFGTKTILSLAGEDAQELRRARRIFARGAAPKYREPLGKCPTCGKPRNRNRSGDPWCYSCQGTFSRRSA